MFKKAPYFIIIAILFFLSGCRPKVNSIPVLMKVEDASKEQLLNEVNRFAKVSSMNAKMDFAYEDLSLSKDGSKKSYPSARATVVVQRPANILLKIEFLSVDVAQMTSNGENFRLAVLRDRSGGKFVKFSYGTNNADYSKLQGNLKNNTNKDLQDASSFANVRPQHITESILVRPIDTSNLYLHSTIFQDENDETRRVTRGYYLLDEFAKDSKGELKIQRRFWFDRVVGVRLARQQLFDVKGEIESDITYGREGKLTNTNDYNNLPLRIVVTRPKEKYTMSLTYQSPESVTIGKTYNTEVFLLKNTWNLEEVNLDQKLREMSGQNSAITNQ